MKLTTEEKIALAKGLRSNVTAIQDNADKMYGETIERLGIPEGSHEESFFFDYIYNDGDLPDIPQLANQETSLETSDQELLRKAIDNVSVSPKAKWAKRWFCVMCLFGVTSNVAISLCRRFGFDPNETVRRNAKPLGSTHDAEIEVERFEVIDSEIGRRFVSNRETLQQLSFSFQDDGKTLKIFL